MCLEAARGQHLTARGVLKLRHLTDEAFIRSTALNDNNSIVGACHFALVRNPKL